MGIEWAMRDGKIFILQARPITSLPEARPTLEWKLPRANGSYCRSSVINLLPEPLSPLFATLGLPFWNEASRDLLQSLGFADLFPPQLLLTMHHPVPPHPPSACGCGRRRRATCCSPSDSRTSFRRSCS